MINLTTAEPGQEYDIIWVLGKYADSLKNAFNITVDQKIKVIIQLKGNIIFSCNGRRFAMSSDIAKKIQLSAC